MTGNLPMYLEENQRMLALLEEANRLPLFALYVLGESGGMALDLLRKHLGLERAEFDSVVAQLAGPGLVTILKGSIGLSRQGKEFLRAFGLLEALPSQWIENKAGVCAYREASDAPGTQLEQMPARFNFRLVQEQDAIAVDFLRTITNTSAVSPEEQVKQVDPRNKDRWLGEVPAASSPAPQEQDGVKRSRKKHSSASTDLGRGT